MLIPLVDVILLLLVFIMLGSTLVMQPGIKVDPPEITEPTTGIADKLVIMLTRMKRGTAEEGDTLYFNDQRMADLTALENELRSMRNRNQFQRHPVIIVRADREADYQKVVNILALARRYGSRVYLATQPEARP